MRKTLMVCLAAVTLVFASAQTTPIFPSDLYLPIMHGAGRSLPIATAPPTSAPTPTFTPTRQPTSTPTTEPTSTPTPEPTPTEAITGEVTILNSVGFVPFEGSDGYYIIGEVANNTSANVQFVRINATLRDSSGGVVGSEFTFTTISKLSPGMKSPFRVISLDLPEAFDSYDLVVTWDKATSESYTLELLNRSSRFDSLNNFRVTGEIHNQHAEAREFVKAVVTVYDSDGNVAGVEFTFANPSDIPPGGTASFEAIMGRWAGYPEQSALSSYIVVAIGN